MKKLSKLKLNEVSLLDYVEMKYIRGGLTSGPAYVECTIKADKSGCSDDTAGKPCKRKSGDTGLFEAGNCMFADRYSSELNICRCNPASIK